MNQEINQNFIQNSYQKTNEMDFTNNGECSRCGKCCQAILTISDKEIQKIKSYIGKRKIKPINHHSLMSTEFVDVCPFLDENNNCLIYPVRPEVCRKFICSEFRMSKKFFNHMDKKIVNMYQVFLKDSYYPMPPVNILELNKEYSMKKSFLSSQKFKRK